MSAAFTESLVETAAVGWLKAIGWRAAHGPDIGPDMPAAERANYGEVVLGARLRDALARLNPTLPAEALEDAYRKLTRLEGTDLIQRNRALHRLLVNGVTVEYRTREGEVRGAQARVIDFDEPKGNDWLAVNQFGVTENKHSRRPDVVLFVNGLPLAVLELKNAADEDATIWTAFQQLQTYQAEIRSLFDPNGVPFYKAVVEVTPEGMKNLRQHQIRAGMPVEVFVRTGERTLTNYLIKPLTDRLQGALTEE